MSYLFTGLLLKDKLFFEMEEYMSTMMYSNYDGATYSLAGSYGKNPDVSFVSPSSYYGDPTRVFDSSGDEKIVGKTAYCKWQPILSVT